MKFNKLKSIFTRKTALVAAAGAAAVPALTATPSHAALSAEMQGALDAAVAAFTDIAAAIGDLVVANIAVAIAIVIGAIIVGYVKSGR